MYVFIPESVRAEVDEFCVIPVTLVPIMPEIRVVPEPAPELVIVPIIFTLFPRFALSSVVPVLVLFIIILPVPAIPPLCKWLVEVVTVKVRLLFSVINPSVLVFVILNVPLLPDATVIALEIKIELRKVASALPLVLPIVSVPVPPAVELVLRARLPALIVTPLVKVLLPVSVNCDVALFWTTPVTLVPMTALIVVVPLPVPELVIVPVLLIDVVDIVIEAALV